MKAIEFLRVSTQEQGTDDRAGIPRQKEANAQTVQKHDLTIIKTITIIDVSGTSVLHTPEVKEMISMMHSGQIQGVVVADWDRLIRLDNFNDFSLLQYFKETGTLIFLPDQVIDLNTQSGFLIGGFQSIISGNELTQIKKRMLEAKEAKRKNGEHPNCEITLPTGVAYDRDSRKFRYTPDAMKVKELFSLFYDKGIQNYRELQRLTGFHHRTIPNLLRNEIFIGYRTYTHKRSPEKNIKPGGRQGDKKKIKRSPDEVIRVKVIDEPLIDENLFREIQEIVQRKSSEYHKKKSKPGERFLYAGFLRCGVCGNIIYTTSGGKHPRKDYYYCRSKNYTYAKAKTRKECRSGYMQKDLVENTITSFVSERITDKDYLNSLIRLAFSDSQFKEIEAKAGYLGQELKKADAKKSKILDLYGDGLFTREELDRKVSALNKEIAGIKASLAGLEKTKHLKKDMLEKESIIPIVTTLAEYPYWTPAEKRTFLKSQIPEFTITKDGIKDFLFGVSELGDRTDKGSLPLPA